MGKNAPKVAGGSDMEKIIFVKTFYNQFGQPLGGVRPEPFGGCYEKIDCPIPELAEGWKIKAVSISGNTTAVVLEK